MIPNTIERFVDRRGRTIGLGLMWVVIALLWIPIGIVTLMSFAADRALAFPPDELTLHWYREFLQNDAAIDAVFTSLQVSVIATLITVVLATILSYAIAKYEFPGKGMIQLVVTLPIIVPLVVVGVAMVLFFGVINVGTGFWSVVIAHVVRTIPFAALIIIPTMLRFDETLEEAAKDLGADELDVFVNVRLPNILPGIVAGGLLAFTISFNEFVYTYFVRDTRTETLPIYLWNQIRFEASPEVNVISVVFLLVAIGMILLALAITNVQRITMR
ncbi:ABC transporter permease [Natrialba sp. SSL1]|uniref:ABC transporter permease n=1 Tax=Natrialba sp. SSL1 TaxID=1869245 RepID=UPI0008F907FA|nr:ABC transporter permease [Natrialba sp. SSL1]OIB58864.1 ABC transporter permease [Natrialba sp. SSL1]